MSESPSSWHLLWSWSREMNELDRDGVTLTLFCVWGFHSPAVTGANKAQTFLKMSCHSPCSCSRMVSPLRAASDFGPSLVSRALSGSEVLDSYLLSRFLYGSLHIGSLWGSELGWYQERRRGDENQGPLMAGLFLSHRWKWKQPSVTLDQMSPSPISAPP